MNFIFKCLTQYLTSECSERVRCRVEHEKIKLASTSGHVIFCLLYKHTNDNVFDDFLKIILTTFRRFLKIFQNCSEGKTNISEHSGHFPKITEHDYRRFLKISEEGPMMF